MADKQVIIKVIADVEDGEVKNLEEIISNIKQQSAKVDVDVDKSELDETEGAIEDLDGTDIDLNVNNIAAMQSIDQIASGFDRLKSGASELGQQVGTVLESAGKQETNKTFLEMNIGAEQASKSLSTINGIVQDLPGDDTALQGLLSSAVAKNANLTANELTNMGTAAADYFSAMSYYGKSSIEAQQDMTNYILAGNTAELERSPILASHIDKLKEAGTVQERSLALQEALNQEGWGGMSQQDTYNNKLETFNGMLERGRYNLGGMLQEGAKFGMDFVMQLDSASGGLVGIGIALGGMASPLVDTFAGLGQVASGITALKTAYTALIPTQWAEAIAGWASIGWILLAIALGIALGLAIIYLYNNCEWFRKGLDALVNGLKRFASMIVTNVQNAINTFSEIIQGIPKSIQACLDWAYNLIMNHPIVQAIIWLGNQLAWGFSALGLGQHSPGKIVQSMEQELDWTSKAIQKSSLADDTSNLGSSISNSFNPSLEGNGSSLNGMNTNITINIDNVDSEDRVNEIVEAVRRALSWDNRTAGRTV